MGERVVNSHLQSQRYRGFQNPDRKSGSKRRREEYPGLSRKERRYLKSMEVLWFIITDTESYRKQRLEHYNANKRQKIVDGREGKLRRFI